MSPHSSSQNAPNHSAESLPAECDRQDAIFSRAFEILRTAISDQAFPAASTAITHQGKLIALKAFGRFTYENNSPEVISESVFDLASVSKVVATTSMAMILYERGLLDLEAPVASIIPEFKSDDSRRLQITLRMLLAHSSGLPAHEKMYLQSDSKRGFVERAMKAPLVTAPGTRTEYSDIGFIVLATALEQIANEPLDVFCKREVFGPLAMAHTTFNPPERMRSQIPPTADDQSFRYRIIQGEVQDENASAMGGVAGHAGVFASSRDVAQLANAMLNGGRPLVRPETLAVFAQRQETPEGTSRALGWDTPSSPSQSGNYFSSRAFGHTGYTGTSLWIDPERQLSVTLLTNRTWPDCKNQLIKKVRPGFHDAVVEAVEANRPQEHS